MTQETFTESQVASLVAKLNTVDVTEQERSLLLVLLQAAVEPKPEVEGFDTTLTPAQTAALVKDMGGIRSVDTPNGSILMIGKNPW